MNKLAVTSSEATLSLVEKLVLGLRLGAMVSKP